MTGCEEQEEYMIRRNKRYKKLISLAAAVSMTLLLPMSVLAEGEPADAALTAENSAITETEENAAAEGTLSDQSQMKENSFRYYEGEPTGEASIAAYSLREDEYAYKKIDGVCYNGNGDPVPGATLKGIDVSEHNGVIDWTQVKNSDVDYAILRIGYGNNETWQDDRYWKRNADACTALGIPFGVYIYSYAQNVEEAKSEAEHVLRQIRGYKLAYPVYLDMEDNSTVKLGKEGLKKNAETFADIILNAGYEVGVYANLNWWNNYLTDPVFDNWHRWVAQYNVQCDYTGHYEMWQCTSGAKVPGIKGSTDVNFYFETYPPTSKNASISYRTHVQNIGWQGWRGTGETAGTEGQSLRLEALEIALSTSGLSGDVSYRTHVQNIGWQQPVSGGGTAGTSGQGLRLEAVQIALTGEVAQYYDIYYRVHAQNFGWLGWAKNDEMAGTVNYGYRLEGLQIQLVRKGEQGPAQNQSACQIKHPIALYTTHVQNIGWQWLFFNGGTAGTEGQSLRLESLKLQIADPIYSGDIVYNTHVQNIGWQPEVRNGQLAGTTGQGLRLDALRIYLTGEMAEHYDVYYRVHIQNEGWLDWTKNGQPAGSEGYAYRMEAMQIKILPKGDWSTPTGNRAFVSK